MTRLTPAGSAGVAVLRVEGDAVALLSEAFTGKLPGPAEIAYGVLKGTDEDPGVLDEVLVVRVPVGSQGPQGSTAQGSVAPAYELHVHGSPFLVAEIIRRLDSVGQEAVAGGTCRPTEEEVAAVPFRERARQLVHTAPSVLGARILLDQAAGAMDRALAEVRGLPMSERAAALGEIAGRGRRCERLFRETTVALVGAVNAGKSTLFNVLVGSDAASVSSEAGTTRDALSERARLGPWPVRFLDTAGERDLSEAAAHGDARALVEQQGQRIALDLAARADVVIRLIPASDLQGALVDKPAQVPGQFCLVTQAASAFGAASSAWPEHAISALEDPAHARRSVERGFRRALGLGPESGSGQEHGEGASTAALWVAGAAVPFDAQSISLLESVARLSEVTDTVLDERLAAL